MDQRKTVLVLEDDPVIALDITLQLENLGFRVVHFETGEDAIDWLATDWADLSVVNFRLGGKMDGITTSRIIRRSTQTPVLFLSGMDLSLLQEHPDFYFGHRVLGKPFSSVQFRSEVINSIIEWGK